MNEALRSGINDDPVEPADVPIVEPQQRLFTRLAKYSPRTRRWHAPVTNREPSEEDEAQQATGA
jgi:hypothetical protein